MEKLAELPVDGCVVTLRSRVVAVSKRGSGASIEVEEEVVECVGPPGSARPLPLLMGAQPERAGPVSDGVWLVHGGRQGIQGRRQVAVAERAYARSAGGQGQRGGKWRAAARWAAAG